MKKIKEQRQPVARVERQLGTGKIKKKQRKRKKSMKKIEQEQPSDERKSKQ